jgi:hypothetical protein
MTGRQARRRSPPDGPGRGRRRRGRRPIGLARAADGRQWETIALTLRRSTQVGDRTAPGKPRAGIHPVVTGDPATAAAIARSAGLGSERS